MNFVLILFLIFLSGFFSMVEMAVVSSRRARLQRMADEGRVGAPTALALHTEPSRFLSTIQIGITSIGILMGALSEDILITPLSEWFGTFPKLAAHRKGLAFAVIVIGLSYLSIVFSELVPKRLALYAPEKIASLVARPMLWLTKATNPLVALLSVSSTFVLRTLRIHREKEPPVTDEEIKVLMQAGAEAGVFHESEQEIVSNVLRLDEQVVGSIMTPRKDVYFIDLEDPGKNIYRQISESPFARIVICKDGLKHILGVLQTSDLLKHVLHQPTIPEEAIALQLSQILRPSLYVLETMTITQLLEHFRKARTQLALIIDEYGELLGLVTLTDVLAGIVGNLPAENLPGDVEAVQREDGSWLIEGTISIERFKHLLNVYKLPGEGEGHFHTLAGFVLQYLGRIPNTADSFECAGLRFEIVDMDKLRVDKVLITRISEEA